MEQFVIYLASRHLWYGPNATEVGTIDKARVFTSLRDAQYEHVAIDNRDDRVAPDIIMQLHR